MNTLLSLYHLHVSKHTLVLELLCECICDQCIGMKSCKCDELPDVSHFSDVLNESGKFLFLRHTSQLIVCNIEFQTTSARTNP